MSETEEEEEPSASEAESAGKRAARSQTSVVGHRSNAACEDCQALFFLTAPLVADATSVAAAF